MTCEYSVLSKLEDKNTSVIKYVNLFQRLILERDPTFMSHSEVTTTFMWTNEDSRKPRALFMVQDVCVSTYLINKTFTRTQRILRLSEVRPERCSPRRTGTHKEETHTRDQERVQLSI